MHIQNHGLCMKLTTTACLYDVNNKLKHGRLPNKMLVAHATEMQGMFSPQPQFSDPDTHHGTCVTHVPWCMPGSLTSGFLWSRRRGKRFRHSRRMRKPHFYVSGKRPLDWSLRCRCTLWSIKMMGLHHGGCCTCVHKGTGSLRFLIYFKFDGKFVWLPSEFW